MAPLGDWYLRERDPPDIQHHPHVHRDVHLLPVEAGPGHDHPGSGGLAVLLLPDQGHHGSG